MNVSPDGFTVRFKTESEELFEVEKSGAKSNTVQILDASEADQIRLKPPTKIIIQHYYHQEVFLRSLTDIQLNYNVLGKVIAIFSWTNENHHHHTIFNEIERDQYAHTMSLDEQEPFLPLKSQAINVSLPLLKRLDLCRVEETYDELLSKLLDDYYKQPPHTHTMPQDRGSEEVDGFVSIDLSRQMFNTLQNSFSGRTMNSVVQELYETYLYKLAEERGPLHD